MVGGESSFQAHVEVLQFFLAHRDAIVERIQGLLNAQRKPIEYLQDRPLLFRHFEDCFFALPGVTESQWQLRGQLEEAHWAQGFRPREIPGIRNGLLDPAEMMIRGFHLWEHTRWPGRNGRVRYAHTLFNLYLIRCLELLSMRIFDAGANSPGDRLAQVQGVLDQLWNISPPDQPALVRDARWLLQLAQSPATNDLGSYFEIARQVAEAITTEERLEVHNAGVLMAGGHLRSQIRHYSLKKGVPIDESSVVLSTRNSNALDFALLIQDLVPVLEAYERAQQTGDEERRLALADVICQGVSPDPELFLNRVELLGAYSMVEHLFITTDSDGHAAYTPMGQRHVQLLHEYEERIARVSKPLHHDCAHFRPAAGTYSPYGIIYGFTSDLLEHMTLRTLVPDAVTQFGLEDVFVEGDATKLLWITGWRKLPHLPAEVTRRFDYPQQFAEEVFNRIELALRTRVSNDESNVRAQTGRLFILPSEAPQTDANASSIPTLSAHYIWSSDKRMVAAQQAEFRDERYLASERDEGKCLVSYRTSAGWVAITKDVLTEVLATGNDATLALPAQAAESLNLTCPTLTVLPENIAPSS